MANPYRTAEAREDDTEEIALFVRAIRRDPESLEGLFMIAVTHVGRHLGIRIARAARRQGPRGA
jgi:hypothetical protein